jgi:hypothetical protein
MANFRTSMNKAPRDRELLFLVPTGEIETPVTREVGWWDVKLRRWEGDWRYYDGPGGYANEEPIGWAELPDIDTEFLKPPASALLPATRADADASGAKPSTTLAGSAAAKARKSAAHKRGQRTSRARDATDTFDPL